GLPFKILEDHQTVNEAEIHRIEGDLWCSLQGEVTFTHGGELVEPRARVRKDGTTDENELIAKEISGGTEVVMKPGDWLWIPAGTAHQHSCTGTARLMIIKIPKS
ncbi:MAG: cupin domain-containing protein, partial [Candidatus Sungbacteria bacterium]|nr:cupin domain-containing protein [Candidatus Sungbacteria bacterium]